MPREPLLPADFSGEVRLFPLPDLVLFPHVVQPLRIFEPRYIAMLEDALQDDQLIAMALLRPGWEDDYEGQPPIHSTVCVGRVLSHSRRPDGCYNLLLAGAARGYMRRELPLERLYRRAEVELRVDLESPPPDLSLDACKQQLLQAFERSQPAALSTESSLRKLLREDIPLGMLSDVIAFAAPLRIEEKQWLLDELSVSARAQFLVERLSRTLDRPTPFPRNFPPDFSDN